MILHIDMDAFYAAIEQLDRPELRGKPVIVGGSSSRGVVSTASYEARKFGVHSAMPMFQARQKCPQAIIVAGRMHRYQQVSRAIMVLLQNFSPLVEPVSIDEAYLDITGCQRLYGPPIEMAAAIKTRIQEAVQLTCSVGIAPLKFLSKIASDMHKPDGLTIIRPEEVQGFIDTLAIAKVPGVGHVTGRQLSRMGIMQLGDVKKYACRHLQQQLGKYGRRLFDLAHGMDSSPVRPHTPVKSVSSEGTLGADTDQQDALRQHLLGHCEDVGRQLRRQQIKAKTVSIKIKHSDFKQVTRSVTLAHPTHASEIIYREACRLFAAYRLTRKVRLIGVGASGLVTGSHPPVQATLFGDHNPDTKEWDKVDHAVDAIARRFGRNIIKKASLQDK